jgi:hypothetical protein
MVVPSLSSHLDFEAKASLFRGVVIALERMGKLQAVQAKLSGSTLALSQHLPPTSLWLAGWNFAELTLAAFEVLGPEQLKQLGGRSILIETAPLLRTVTEGFLRVFGVSPHSILSRLETTSSLTVRGVRQAWTRTGDHQGVVHFTYERSRDVPECLFILASGMFDPIFELCKVRGATGHTGVSGALRNECAIQIEWWK